MIYHHFNLEFTDPVKQSAHKELYSIAGMEELELPMNVSIKNKVVEWKTQKFWANNLIDVLSI